MTGSSPVDKSIYQPVNFATLAAFIFVLN